MNDVDRLLVAQVLPQPVRGEDQEGVVLLKRMRQDGRPRGQNRHPHRPRDPELWIYGLPVVLGVLHVSVAQRSGNLQMSNGWRNKGRRLAGRGQFISALLGYSRKLY